MQNLQPLFAPVVPLVGSGHGGSVHDVVLTGEWDHATVPAMRRDVAASLGAIRPGSELLLDLRNVSFCGSAGARAIVELVEQARCRHVVLHLAGVRPNVQRVFELLGLGDLVNGDPAVA